MSIDQVDLLAKLLVGTDNDVEVVVAKTFHTQVPDDINKQLALHDLHQCSACNHWCIGEDMSDYNLICLDCLG